MKDKFVGFGLLSFVSLLVGPYSVQPILFSP